MMRYFTFDEMTTTNSKLNNIPSNWEQIENLMRLTEYLDGIRERFGKAIRVNSGFRSKAVNKAVGGSDSSAHTKGLAADICAYDGTEKSNRALLELLESEIDNIDQLISYHKQAGNAKGQIRFIHVGLAGEGREPRKQRLYF